MAPPGISSTTPLKALGNGRGWFPDFVTMTFQEKQRWFRASSLAKRQAGSNVSVPGADLNVGMNSSCQFSQGILGVSEFEIVCFLQK